MEFEKMIEDLMEDVDIEKYGSLIEAFIEKLSAENTGKKEKDNENDTETENWKEKYLSLKKQHIKMLNDRYGLSRQEEKEVEEDEEISIDDLEFDGSTE